MVFRMVFRLKIIMAMLDPRLRLISIDETALRGSCAYRTHRRYKITHNQKCYIWRAAS